jgi:hydrogenase expression/formation protein HypC
MCIGIPMQVIALQGSHALCEGRGERGPIGTALVGDVAPGDWLLVFQGDARQRIGAAQAAEINAALDLVHDALSGQQSLVDDAGFALPSQMSAGQLRALTGA